MKREDRALQLWSLLAFAATNRQVLTYDQTARLTGVLRPGLGDLLRPIQQYCVEKNLPPLTVLVVSEATGLPGEGFVSAADVPGAQAQVFRHVWMQTDVPSAEQLADAYSRAPERR